MTACPGVVCATLLAAFLAPAQATVVTLAADGQWHSFAIDDPIAPSFGVGWTDSETRSPG